MMKKILTLFIIFFAVFCTCNSVLASRFTPVAGNNFEEHPIKLAQGSFLRASVQREISTATNKIGDEVIGTVMYVLDNGVLGYVESEAKDE